jgi:hypothetical protein
MKSVSVKLSVSLAGAQTALSVNDGAKVLAQ